MANTNTNENGKMDKIKILKARILQRLENILKNVQKIFLLFLLSFVFFLSLSLR